MGHEHSRRPVSGARDVGVGTPARALWTRRIGLGLTTLGALTLIADFAVLVPGVMPSRPWGVFGGVLVGSAGAGLLVWGLVTSRTAARDWVTNANLALLSLLGFSPLLLEAVFRIGIAAGSTQFRQPGLYANYDSEDDYWKLRVAWGLDRGHAADIAGQLHPDFGWAPPVTPDNPLGILRHGAYIPDYDGDVILFYGDSFVAGSRHLEPGTRVSDALERGLPGRPVYNYAGGGYGVDQIALRFQRTHRLFARPTLIFGVLPADLDRSVLSFRSGAKPYFEMEDGALVLRGVPILLDPAEFVRQNPPVVRSYLFSYARQQARRLAAGGDLDNLTHRLDEKISVNRALIESVVAEARARELAMLWVLFQSPKEFDRPGWREEFLAAEFERHGVRWVDTREVIRAVSAREGIPIDSYFFEDGHPNGKGNEAIGSAIAMRLTQTEFR